MNGSQSGWTASFYGLLRLEQKRKRKEDATAYFLLSICVTALCLTSACGAEHDCAISQPVPSLEAIGDLNKQKRSSVLMLPCHSACPRTGGERNMDFFARGLHALDGHVHVLAPAGPLMRLYDSLGIPHSRPSMLHIAQRDAQRFRMKAHQVETRMNEAIHCADASSCAPERTLHPIEPLMAELYSMLLAEGAAATPWLNTTSLSVRGLGTSPRLVRALQLRRAAEQTDADVLFADLGRDAEAAVLGLVGTQREVLWYQQMTAPEASDRFLARNARVVTCGEGVRQQRFADENVAAVANGIDTRRFTKAAGPKPDLLLHGGAEALVIGNVATVEPRKNQRLLVQAVGDRIHELGNVHLYFFGRLDLSYQEDYLSDTLALADKLGIAHRVHFVGSHEDIERYLPHFDVFVLPSRVEGMPLALLEAMSARVASVASDIPATQEMASEGVAFFSLKQPQTLGDQLVALAKDPERRRKMGAAGRYTVFERNFTIEAMLRNMYYQVTNTATRTCATKFACSKSGAFQH